MKQLIIFGLLFLSKNLCGQVDSMLQKVAPRIDEPVQFIEAMPQFPGGEAALLKFLRDSIRYPVDALLKKTEGVVFATFVVLDGKISEIKIVKGLSKTIDAETIRVIQSMPHWKDCDCSGRRNRINLPVRFKIDQ